MTKSDLFIQLANPRKGVSDFICVDCFVGEYSGLKFGNGVDFARRGSSITKKYKILTVKNNGTVRFLWEPSPKEEEKWTEKAKQLSLGKGRKVKYIKLCGYLNGKADKRPISKKIRDHFKSQSCIICDTTSETVIDHKNGLYNDPRVLDVDTQTVDDFQVLCTHCNLRKRQTIKDMIRTGIRYPGNKIKICEHFNIPYTSGDESYDKNDPDWGVGTYWHDPVEFIKRAFEIYHNRKNEKLVHKKKKLS